MASFICNLETSKINGVFGEARKVNQGFDINLISKLLINGWYDECAYHDPTVEDPNSILKPDTEESFNRLRFPSWRVAQAYYSIYHTTAAIIRLKEQCKETSHNIILRSLGNHFESELKNFFPYPLCCYIKDDKFFNHSDDKREEDGLRGILFEFHEDKKKRGMAEARYTSILHIFQGFREWCNYNAGEVLILFRSKHLRDYLDINLRTVVYFINGINEIYLIKFLGYEKVVDIFEDFYKSTVVNLRFEPKTIARRFEIYEHGVKNLDDSFILANKARNRFQKEKNLDILNELGKDYFSKGWIFHARHIFNFILWENTDFDKARVNLEKIDKHLDDLKNVSSIKYRTDYFDDKSLEVEIIPRERFKQMRKERQEKAKLLDVKVGLEWGTFFVKSQSNENKEYEVMFGISPHCDCHDFKFRRKIIKECKHIKAAQPIWNNMQLV